MSGFAIVMCCVIQVTTQSHLLSNSEIEELEQTVSMTTYCFLLQEFDTELDFSNNVRLDYKRTFSNFVMKLYLLDE